MYSVHNSFVLIPNLIWFTTIFIISFDYCFNICGNYVFAMIFCNLALSINTNYNTILEFSTGQSPIVKPRWRVVMWKESPPVFSTGTDNDVIHFRQHARHQTDSYISHSFFPLSTCESLTYSCQHQPDDFDDIFPAFAQLAKYLKEKCWLEHYQQLSFYYLVKSFSIQKLSWKVPSMQTTISGWTLKY